MVKRCLCVGGRQSCSLVIYLFSVLPALRQAFQSHQFCCFRRFGLYRLFFGYYPLAKPHALIRLKLWGMSKTNCPKINKNIFSLFPVYFPFLYENQHCSRTAMAAQQSFLQRQTIRQPLPAPAKSVSHKLKTARHVFIIWHKIIQTKIKKFRYPQILF